MKYLIVSLLWLFSYGIVTAQDTAAVSAQETIESILDGSTDEQDLRDLGEELEYLQQHPINITKPNYNDLMKLPFISPMLAEAIVLYTDTVHITSFDQLLEIELMSEEIYKQLLPFITLQKDDSQSFISYILPQRTESRTRYETRLQQPRGYSNNTYRGDIASTYQRVRIGNENVELAGLFEKDAGELYNDGFIAGYLAVQDLSIVQRAIVGNFTITSGQGLVFAKNIATSKGSNAVGQILKRGALLSPSVSTDEFRFFQGIAVHGDVHQFSLLGFYSDRLLPANVNDAGSVTSFYQSGTYRTVNDLKRKNALNEQVIGGVLRYAIDPVKAISLTLVSADYNKSISPSIFTLDNGKSITAGSLSWELPFSRLTFFGEIASNEGKAFSKIIGTIIPLARGVAFSYHHRSFTKGFVSPFARPFGEREIISDGEIGNYVGMEFQVGRLVITSYGDMFTLPSTDNHFAVTGHELFLHSAYSIGKNVDVFLQVRNKEKYSSFLRVVDDQRTQTNYRVAYTIQVTKQLMFTQRAEMIFVSYKPSGYSEKGLLTFVEGRYKHKQRGVDLKSRIVFFDTDSYDSRVYQYESDVAGNFSNPPMYGTGIRWYFIAGYELFPKFNISVKYSETKRLFDTVIGSDNDKIIGNVDNYLVLQIDFRM